MSRWRDAKKGKITPKKPIINKSRKHGLIDKRQLSLSSRMKSFLIDTFLINMPIMYLTIYVLMGGGSGFSQNMIYGWSLILLMNFIVVIAFWSIKGQTPGLKAYEGLVVDSNTNMRVSVLKAFVRYMMTLLCILSIIGIILPFFRKDKKTLQDLLSNTFISNESSK